MSTFKNNTPANAFATSTTNGNILRHVVQDALTKSTTTESYRVWLSMLMNCSSVVTVTMFGDEFCVRSVAVLSVRLSDDDTTRLNRGFGVFLIIQDVPLINKSAINQLNELFPYVYKQKKNK